MCVVVAMHFNLNLVIVVCLSFAAYARQTQRGLCVRARDYLRSVAFEPRLHCRYLFSKNVFRLGF